MGATLHAEGLGQQADVWRNLFIASLGTIEAACQYVARRHRMPAAEAEDFASIVRLRIMADDYAILRKFQGRSSLKTYLTVVIQRIFLDERVAEWGKWRPSRRAQREGPAAVLLERLILKDGLPFQEACAAMEVNHGLRLPADVLARLSVVLDAVSPRGRGIRRFVPEEEIAAPAAESSAPDAGLLRAEQASVAARVAAALARIVDALSPADRQVLELRFRGGCSVADISRRLGLDQKSLYRRFERLLRLVRTRLEADGISAPVVTEILGRPEIEVSSDPLSSSRSRVQHISVQRM